MKEGHASTMARRVLGRDGSGEVPAVVKEPGKGIGPKEGERHEVL
jgi:hypothetical protein